MLGIFFFFFNEEVKSYWTTDRSHVGYYNTLIQNQGRTGHCYNAALAARLFFENAMLLLRMPGI
jgi:hypothetical protein